MKNDPIIVHNGVTYKIEEEYVMVYSHGKTWKCPVEKYGLWILLNNLRVIHSIHRPYQYYVVQT